MIGCIVGVAATVVGTAYAYKNNKYLRKELDGIVDWIDDQIDYVFGTDAPKTCVPNDGEPKEDVKPDEGS